jgi:hypothetical protein
MSHTIISIAWQTEIMPGRAFDYFHKACYAEHGFKSETRKNGVRRELSSEEVATDVICSHCQGKLREQTI